MQIRITHHPRLAVLLIMLWTSTGLAQSRSSASQPTTQNSAATVNDVAALVEAGQYADALRAISRLLPAARGGGSGQDRHELLMLRAESQLRLKNRDAAIATLGDVARESEQALDVNGQCEAIALTILIQRSNNFIYTTKTLPDKTPLNILEPASRKSAYQALLSDELASLRALQGTARFNTTLAPLVEICRSYARVQTIERAATGGLTQTTSLAKELSQWATRLSDEHLIDFDADITRIASDIGRTGSTRKSGSGVHSGVNEQQAQVLNDMISNCQKISDLMQEMSRAFGQADNLTSTATRSRAVADRANTFLQGGYAPPVPKKSSSGK